MLIKIFSYFFIAVLLTSMGCAKKEDSQDINDYAETIIFGRFILSSGCFESESCVEIFKISSKGLAEDINDNVPNNDGFYDGNFSTILTNSDYRQVETLFRTSIPKELLEMDSGSLGTFPSWNTNNYYFEYKSSKIHKHWIIDGSFDGSLGITLQNFIQKIQDAVNISTI